MDSVSARRSSSCYGVVEASAKLPFSNYRADSATKTPDKVFLLISLILLSWDCLPLLVLKEFSLVNAEWWMWLGDVLGMMQMIWRTMLIMKIPWWCGVIFPPRCSPPGISSSSVLPASVGSVTERFVCFVHARDGWKAVNDNQTAVYRIISGLDQLQ